MREKSIMLRDGRRIRWIAKTSISTSGAVTVDLRAALRSPKVKAMLDDVRRIRRYL